MLRMFDARAINASHEPGWPEEPGWPDEPDDEALKERIESFRFRVGLMFWYCWDDQSWNDLWKRLLDERRGFIIPFDWVAASRPQGKSFLDLTMGQLSAIMPGLRINFF